jgi:RNA polymerase sigma-70 factor, ECF subfamily
VLPAIVLTDAPGAHTGSPPRLRLIRGMGNSDDSVANARQEDMRLVSRFNRGDPAAFTELFNRHQKDVARLVVRMLGSSSDAQDVMQEVFLQVFRSLPEFRGKSRLSTWIYRVAVNVVLMHRRAGRSRPILTGADLAPPPMDVEPLPDEQVELSLRVAALERLMVRLSEKKRTVFVLHELQGLSPSEIADIVGAPVLTVRTRLFYARRELMTLIGRDAALSHLFADLKPGAEREMSPESEREPVAKDDPRLRGET